ncbi:MAG TPA: DegT/DnrJ/EryC1/StrS family aminotransferase [Syntrophales bacterium]|nr:DegT/DnrJ/EryC1/StrS family aminotransferase [Syntrophales bacterium]
MIVPFLDLNAQYRSIKEEIDAAVRAVLEECAFISGPYVARFEEEFALFCGRRHAVAVSSGTSALWLALCSMGIGPGDEVITVPNTFIATAEAISRCGAQPVFVDVEETTFTMNAALIERALTPRTRAVVPVHLYGQCADMDPIMEIAASRNLRVVEDACQSHGAQYRGRQAGSIGDAGCFSFYPGKNLGAFGDAGAVVTDDPELASRIRMMRDHGQPRKYHHDFIGWNDRMDGIQGAVLSVKLGHLAAWNESRRGAAGFYRKCLEGMEGVALPEEAGYGKHVFHIFGIRSGNRDRLLEYLSGRGIQCGIHYPVPIHLQSAYRHLGFGPGSYPVAEKIAREALSLPMYPELKPEQIRFTSEEIRKFHTMAQSGRESGTEGSGNCSRTYPP